MASCTVRRLHDYYCSFLWIPCRKPDIQISQSCHPSEAEAKREKARRAEVAKESRKKAAEKREAAKNPGGKRKSFSDDQMQKHLQHHDESEIRLRTKQGTRLNTILKKFREHRPIEREITIEQSCVAFNWQRSLGSLISLLKNDAQCLGEHEDGGLFHLALVVLDQGVQELDRLTEKALFEYKNEVLKRGKWEEHKTTDDDYLEEVSKKPKKAKTKLEEVDETFREAAEERKRTLRSGRAGSVDRKLAEKTGKGTGLGRGRVLGDVIHLLRCRRTYSGCGFAAMYRLTLLLPRVEDYQLNPNIASASSYG